MDNNIIFYVLGGITALVAGFKAVDWLISLKYNTKDDCEKCREAILKGINNDRELLTRLDTKMDLLLKHMKITVSNVEK